MDEDETRRWHTPNEWFNLLERLAHTHEQHGEIIHLLNRIDRKQDRIMTSQENLDAKVAQLNKALGEIRGLVDTLNATVADLTAQVAAGGTVNLTGLTDVAQQLDDVVPDAPVTP